MNLQETEVENKSSNGESTSTQSRIETGKKAKKPADFAKFEKATKDILAAQGTSYHEWLHKLHKEFVEGTFFANLDNVDKLVTK